MQLMTQKQRDTIALVESEVPIVCRNLSQGIDYWEDFFPKATLTAGDLLAAIGAGWEYKAAPPKPRSIWASEWDTGDSDMKLGGVGYESKELVLRFFEKAKGFVRAVEFVEKMD